MVDQRRKLRRNLKKTQTNGQAWTGAPLWQLARQSEALRGAASSDDPGECIDQEPCASLNDDLLILSGGGVLGLDPGNEALLFSRSPCHASLDDDHGGGHGTIAPLAAPPPIVATHQFGGQTAAELPPLPFFGERAVAEDAHGGQQRSGLPPAGTTVLRPTEMPLFGGSGMEDLKREPKTESPPEKSMGMSVDSDDSGADMLGIDSVAEDAAVGQSTGAACVRGESNAREARAHERDARRASIFFTAGFPGSAALPRPPGRSKGVTMCLRTLLRQLLAGTGWIMDSSISKDHATYLIRQLVGPDLDNQLEIQLSARRAETMSSEDKETHYSKILAELVSKYIGKPVRIDVAQEFIKRDKGPYHLTQEFVDLLSGKQWPPQILPERELRKFGCYRQGEASKRGRGHD